MISGVYKITNNINGKVYIGKSINIQQRWQEHKRHYKYVDNIVLYKAFRKYGVENFTFEILCEAPEQEIDSLEVKYIEEYNCCTKSGRDSGYNMTFGGDANVHLSGEWNGNSKMTCEEVWEIREAYKNGRQKREVYGQYSHKISFNTFCDIWTGKRWNFINMNVYTEENKRFQRSNYDKIKSHETIRVLTDEQVLEIRDFYNEGILTKAEVYKNYKEYINPNTFNDVWNNNTFQHIQSKKENKRKRGMRNVNQNGTLNPASKLTEDDIIYIRSQRNKGKSMLDVFEEYSHLIGKHTLRNVWKDRTYKEIVVD